jgi:hypothetical protein
VPAAKKQGANTIDAVRDLEIPNEDTKLLERLLALLLDQCAGPSIRQHNEASVRGGDIMVNLYTMQEQFHKVLSKRELHLLLLLDCSKGFNRLSHSWLKRLLHKARAPANLVLSIVRLVFTQIAYLLFTGFVFDRVGFACGLSALSGFFFVLACACLLASIAIVAGVVFCKWLFDDFK